MKTRTLLVKLLNLKEKKGRTFFGPQQGQSPLLLPSIVSKSSFKRLELLSHVFATAGLRQVNLFSSTVGMVCLGIKMIQTEYRLVWVGMGCGICGSCQYTFKKFTPPVHLNMAYRVSVLRGPLSVMKIKQEDHNQPKENPLTKGGVGTLLKTSKYSQTPTAFRLRKEGVCFP